MLVIGVAGAGLVAIGKSSGSLLLILLDLALLLLAASAAFILYFMLDVSSLF